MDFQIYLDRLQTILKDKIIERDFIDTGALLESIEFRIEETAQGISIELGANDYIQYLDGGRFIEEFFNSLEVETIMDEAIAAWIESKLN